mmetsp:Transcript_63179/g.176724  ORF Transcript_63179/g.176724 Transcript_63179/m.176724 type:complete len:94 (+) Transcript_63179:87-368(+)
MQLRRQALEYSVYRGGVHEGMDLFLHVPTHRDVRMEGGARFTDIRWKRTSSLFSNLGREINILMKPDVRTRVGARYPNSHREINIRLAVQVRG